MNFQDAQKRLSKPALIGLLLMINLLILTTILPASLWGWISDRLPVFTTIFLGIFIEAVPFLMLGTLASGVVEEFVSQESLKRLIPSGALTAPLTGALMGLFFPVCECGVVPLTRRLFSKGLPIPAGIAFLLAAPVLNPIVILSTAAAFGWGQVLFWRLGLSFSIALITGLVFSAEKDPANILRSGVQRSPIDLSSQAFSLDLHLHDHADHPEAHSNLSLIARLSRVLVTGANEFFEMGRYLVIGAALAAAMQTLVPQSALLSIGGGPVISVLIMLLLAVVLSICSTVDAFIALGFASSFSLGSILAFLVFGPMVDIKSILMYGRVFRPRAVLYLVLLPFLMSLLAGIAINYYLP